MSDYIIYYRGLHDDWLFNASKVKSKLEAWLDLIVHATKPEGDCISFPCSSSKLKIGQSNRGLDAWGRRWGWSRAKVSRFFDHLERLGYLTIEGDRNKTLITICEYERFINPELGPYDDYVRVLSTGTGPTRASLKVKREREKERGKMSNSMRYDILRRDGFKCKACGATATDSRLAVDHIIPIAKGGKSTIDNLQTLCFPCNAGKCAKL